MQSSFDTKWRRRAIQGDADAVGQLARDALQPLFRFCFYRLGHQEHLCEEVVQETLVQAISRLENYDPQRSRNNIFPWICGLARNEIRRALAREKSSVSLETMWAKMDQELRGVFMRLESEPFGDETLEREETRQMVNATMSQLPSQYGSVLEAKYVLGRSVRDIAAAMSTTEKAVESQISRARRAFRETFMALAQNLSLETGT